MTARYADLMRQGFMKSRKPARGRVKRPTVSCDACLNWHEEGRHTASKEERARNLKDKKLRAQMRSNRHPYEDRELEEMEEMLAARGYPPRYARQLQDEGMGPEMLRGMLAIPAGEMGSLDYAYGLRRAGSMRSNHVDRLRGGQADRMSTGDFDPVALAKGTLHEMEHTDDPDIAEEIAMDHLAEDEGYYEKLDAMERGYFRNGADWTQKEISDHSYGVMPAWARGVRPAGKKLTKLQLDVLGRVDGSRISFVSKPFFFDKTLDGMFPRSVERKALLALLKGGYLDIYSEHGSLRSVTGENYPPSWVGVDSDSHLLIEAAGTSQLMRRNSGDYYVWPLSKDGQTPLASEGPYGPYELYEAKSFARIGATQGKHSRAVTRGKDPNSKSFEIVRLYKAGTGERIL